MLIFSGTGRWWHTDYIVYGCCLNYVWLEVGLTFLDFLIYFPSQQTRRTEERWLFSDTFGETPRGSTCLLNCRVSELWTRHIREVTTRDSPAERAVTMQGQKLKSSPNWELLHCTCRLLHKNMANADMPLKYAHMYIKRLLPCQSKKTECIYVVTSGYTLILLGLVTALMSL